MLRVADVSFAYARSASDPRAPRVLSNVTFDVPRGAIVGLLGPNGSGKTTLLRVIAGLLTPLTGAVTLDGGDVRRLTRRDLARRMAVVPQETHSPFDYSVLDIVLMGRYSHLGAFELEGPDDMAAARAALDATGTAPLEQRRFATLSGGEKQRVIIASALAQATTAMLLDEPTASLDVRYQLDIGTLLRRLNADRQMTMIVSTHDLNFAAANCSDLVLLRGGRVLGTGATADVLTPANIGELYGVEAEVGFHARAGHLTVIPIAHGH